MSAYPTFGEAVRVWARVALLSFGGPAGQIAVMHRILVEEKKWIGEDRFLHALNFCMLLPGPEAQQLATYIGWLLHRVKGGLVAGLLFILPGLVAMMALSWLYVLYGRATPVAALFFGLKAAVLAIVVQAVVRIGARAIGNSARRLVAAVAFLGIFLLDIPFPLIVLGAGLVGFAAARAGSKAFAAGGGHGPGGTATPDAETALGTGLPDHARDGRRLLPVSLLLLLLWLVPVGLLVATGAGAFADIALFFSQMAVVTFGGAYAVLAYVAQAAVDTYHWLQPGEMLDGLGLAETTPGPLIMVTQFVGFLGAYRDPGGLPPLLAGTLGGLLTTWVTFLPCFLWIFAGAPWIERLRENRALAGALAAITAAVVGVILNLAVWFAIHFLFARVTERRFGPDIPDWASLDPLAALLSAAALVAVFRFRIGMIPVLAGSALLGFLFKGL
ncbi:chromate efflux transporter [Sphingomonas sp. LY54]|uniref:chromate efflux transporter n=1 Tax=Sphingomonas sp. LY54 TaxID=3095343 RepID=UPI002D77C622|nr:chromate efflux transporter [Sphingomonas sp. LY54]WRP30212.1 chromate efflux transporter [Sphingomonas sp. LY54]